MEKQTYFSADVIIRAVNQQLKRNPADKSPIRIERFIEAMTILSEQEGCHLSEEASKILANFPDGTMLCVSGFLGECQSSDGCGCMQIIKMDLRLWKYWCDSTNRAMIGRYQSHAKNSTEKPVQKLSVVEVHKPSAVAKPAGKPTWTCKFANDCCRPDCRFTHPPKCHCTDPNCGRYHPEFANCIYLNECRVKDCIMVHPRDLDCDYGGKCLDAECLFRHPKMHTAKPTANTRTIPKEVRNEKGDAELAERRRANREKLMAKKPASAAPRIRPEAVTKIAKPDSITAKDNQPATTADVPEVAQQPDGTCIVQ